MGMCPWFICAMHDASSSDHKACHSTQLSTLALWSGGTAKGSKLAMDHATLYERTSRKKLRAIGLESLEMTRCLWKLKHLINNASNARCS
eukprot:6326832-Amphidinium_carterae.1